MTARVARDPFPIVVRANNWFHAGWLDAILGSPRREFADPNILVRDADCDAYEDGYTMAEETETFSLATVRNMRSIGSITVRGAVYGKVIKKGVGT